MNTSSLTKKVIVGGTGLLLAVYLVLHLAGNLLLFAGQRTFNAYAASLIANPLTLPVEIALAAVFCAHLVQAIAVTVGNRQARPTPYVIRTPAKHTSRRSVASRSMAVTGVLVLLFVPIHVWMFRFAAAPVDSAMGVRDLHSAVVGAFQSPMVAVAYAAAMAVVGLHLWHGTSSACQSLGLSGPRLTRWIQAIGRALAVGIAGGFVVVVVWAFLGGGQ